MGGAAILPASLSAARLTRVLRASGLPAAVSRSAGDYICNQALYLSLSAARAQAEPPCKVGFIHLPRPGSSKQTPDRLARPGIAAMGRAVGACLLDMARYI